MEILATGALQRREDHGDGTSTAHWHSDALSPSYLVCLVPACTVQKSLPEARIIHPCPGQRLAVMTPGWSLVR